MSAPQLAGSQGFEITDEVPHDAELARGRAAIAEIIDLTPAQVAAYMRERDDAQLMKQLTGEASDEWFYSFKIQGTLVEGVSIVGAMEFARLRAEQGFPIRFPIHNIEAREVERNGERGVECLAIARDHRTGAEGVGLAFYPYALRKKDGSLLDDRFADRKALSVAKRNAILDLVPEAMVRQMLKSWKTKGKNGGAPETRETRRGDRPAPVQQASDAQRAELARLAKDPAFKKESQDTLAAAAERELLTADDAETLLHEARGIIEKRKHRLAEAGA